MSGERQGRAVLVTGASRGIGAAVAHAFAAQGDRVAVHFGRRADQAEAVAAALPGTGHAVVGADLADPEAVRGMVDGAAEALGGLDVLVNNAGVFVPHPITATTYEAWQRAWRDTLAVNLVGPANACWCAVPHLRRGGAGRIVNVASRGAFRGEPDQPAYGASKAGLVALGQSLARALGPLGIAVTAVAPGLHRDRHGGGGARRPGGRRPAGGEPAGAHRLAGRGRGGGRLPRLARGRAGQRHGARPQRGLAPAPLSAGRARGDPEGPRRPRRGARRTCAGSRAA